MKTTKAVITAAGRNQRRLPLQTLVDRDGETKSVLTVVVEEALDAGIERIAVVVYPGDELEFRGAAGEHADSIEFVEQADQLGYGHAIYCARAFVGDEPFLHMIGDHVYVSAGELSCARQLIEAAESQSCAVSAVQATRENQLPYFGAVGGRRVEGSSHLYTIDMVLEKPTPTLAEQTLIVPGLRAGHYLCFFGMHVFTPTVIELLSGEVERDDRGGRVELSPVLAQLAQRERYLALEAHGRRYPLDAKYGLLTAQLALGLSGADREEVLAGLVELLAQRAQSAAGSS